MKNLGKLLCVLLIGSFLLINLQAAENATPLDTTQTPATITPDSQTPASPAATNIQPDATTITVSTPTTPVATPATQTSAPAVEAATTTPAAPAQTLSDILGALFTHALAMLDDASYTGKQLKWIKLPEAGRARINFKISTEKGTTYDKEKGLQRGTLAAPHVVAVLAKEPLAMTPANIAADLTQDVIVIQISAGSSSESAGVTMSSTGALQVFWNITQQVNVDENSSNFSSFTLSLDAAGNQDSMIQFSTNIMMPNDSAQTQSPQGLQQKIGNINFGGGKSGKSVSKQCRNLLGQMQYIAFASIQADEFCWYSDIVVQPAPAITTPTKVAATSSSKVTTKGVLAPARTRATSSAGKTATTIAKKRTIKQPTKKTLTPATAAKQTKSTAAPKKTKTTKKASPTRTQKSAPKTTQKTTRKGLPQFDPTKFQPVHSKTRAKRPAPKKPLAQTKKTAHASSN